MRDLGSVETGERVIVRGQDGRDPRLPETLYQSHTDHGIILTVNPGWEITVPFDSWMHVEDMDGRVLALVDPEADAVTGPPPDLE